MGLLIFAFFAQEKKADRVGCCQNTLDIEWLHHFLRSPKDLFIFLKLKEKLRYQSMYKIIHFPTQYFRQ